MPKNNQNYKKRNNRVNAKSRKNKREQTGTTQPARMIRSLPVGINPSMPFRRAIRRAFAFDYSTIDGVGTSPTMQLSFAPSATDYRINGVSVYSTALPGASEFYALFDQYKIMSVTVRIDIPASYANGGTTPINLPNLYYVADYDDSADCGITDMLQYPQVQVHNFYKDGYTPFMVKLSPKPLRDIAGSGISTGYGPMPTAPWIRTAEPSIPHYGLKLAFDFFGLIQTADIPMVTTIWYDLAFTNPK